MISYSSSSHVTDTKTKKPDDRRTPLDDAPSLDTRVLGAAAKPKSYGSTRHTIAPAYNKGAYQVISKQNIKDIGR
ncbi:MAG: hypothetical protein CML42_00010 [Rhodobacteraceae bacterium]|nr:hypothetical protein [Paracoccaceae bacterium]